MGNAVIGFDPGPTDFTWVISRDSLPVASGTGDFLDATAQEGCKVAVVERPMPWGGLKIKKVSLYRTLEMTGELLYRLRLSGLIIYAPGRMPILQQLGWNNTVKRQQGLTGDQWLACYFRETLKLGKLHLKNTHQRAAFAASLFAHRHPDNQKYLEENHDE
jgi:hypothetical protein